MQKRALNVARSFRVTEPEVLSGVPRKMNQRRWLGVMSLYGLIAILAFMLVPVITLTFGDVTTNYIENIKNVVNFGAPTLLLVAVLVGVTGYFGYTRIAWWMSFGFWVSVVVLVINIATRINWLNLGIFWIIIGTLVGLFLGCAFELVVTLHWHREKYLVVLLIIGMLASGIASVVAFQNSYAKGSSSVSIMEAQHELAYALYQPKVLPTEYAVYTPKVFVMNREFHMYYGDDNYPPPPVLDFLKGLEIIESAAPATPPIDLLGSAVQVEVSGTHAQYRESHGRSILQWTQGQTAILVISYSPVNGKELIDFARSFTPFTQ